MEEICRMVGLPLSPRSSLDGVQAVPKRTRALFALRQRLATPTGFKSWAEHIAVKV